MLRHWGKEILDVRVSQRRLKRAMRIMRALLTRIKCLGFPINLVTIADLKRQRRLEDKERERQRQEELKAMEELERQRQEEHRRLQDLENQAFRWTKAAQLRSYITEVEKKASGSDLPTEEQERLASWLRWARGHADRIDPLIGDAWKGSSSLKKS
jgi:hypothetical protein